jgi:TetR/AcrR family transcriptional regulator
MASRVVAARTDEVPRQEHTERRDRILRAALEEFANRGFDGTTTAEIARRAGVTQPLVHYHFDDKDTLWQATMQAAFEGVIQSFEGVLAELADLDLIDRLKVLVRRYVWFCAAHPEIGRIVSHEGVQGGPRLQWLIDHHMAGQFDWFRDLYDAAVADGLVKDLPAEHVVACLSASGAHLFMVRAAMHEMHGLDVTDPAVVEAHADTLVELFFHGIVATPSVRPPSAGAAS